MNTDIHSLALRVMREGRIELGLGKRLTLGMELGWDRCGCRCEMAGVRWLVWIPQSLCVRPRWTLCVKASQQWTSGVPQHHQCPSWTDIVCEGLMTDQWSAMAPTSVRPGRTLCVRASQQTSGVSWHHQCLSWMDTVCEGLTADQWSAMAPPVSILDGHCV